MRGSRKDSGKDEKKKENKQTEESKQKHPRPSTSKENEQGSSKKNKSKKDKRNLRFQLPSHDTIISEESYNSNISFSVADDDYEDFIPPQTMQYSILKKYILSPMRHSQPRAATLNPHFRGTYSEVLSELKIEPYISETSSSKVLFEVQKNSPTSSALDLQLIKATYIMKIDSIKEAIQKGANVNTLLERQPPLLIAAEIGDDRLVAYFLMVPGINLDLQNAFGQTALILALMNGFTKIVQLLVEHKANVNIADNMGRTPLHIALFQQRPDLVRLLLAYGADYEREDYFGEKPLYTAMIKKPHLACLKLLLKVGASPDYTNLSGIPLLSRAIMCSSRFYLIETLVVQGASVNCPDLFTRRTPLHFAAMTNDLRVAKFLIKRGANPNQKTFHNMTPYDEAVLHKSFEVAEFLFNKTEAAGTKLHHSIRPNKS